MNKESRYDAKSNPMTDCGTLRADTLVLLNLMLSARTALEQSGADQSCRQIMSECISEFRKRHEITTFDYSIGTKGHELSAPGLMRLLVYAQAEAADTLNDAQCAESLEQCIANFMKTNKLTPKQLYGDTILHS